jgi:hypothetical protein
LNERFKWRSDGEEEVEEDDDDDDDTMITKQEHPSFVALDYDTMSHMLQKAL